MIIRQAFNFEAIPFPHQEQQCSQNAGACRYVFNRALALQKERYEQKAKHLNYAGLCRELTAWRHHPDTAWLKDCPSQALQQSLKDLDRAFKNFFAGRAAFPRFKRRGKRDSFRYPQGIKLDQGNRRIFLPKIGWVRYRKSREVQGEICNVTVSRYCDKWFVSIQTERELEAPVHPSQTAIGLDVGVARLATLSDGSHFPAINSFKQHQVKLARYQRCLSKKQKFSANWKKQVLKISRLHQKISYIRQDYLHQLTHVVSKNHALICIEDLQIKQMSKSAAGTVSAPGKQVKAKSGLNKALLDQGWYELRRQLEYKQAWRGGRVLAVAAAYTSQTCPVCSHIAKENRPTQSVFCCINCNYQHHADKVAAINILRAGHARLACGETVQLGRSVKQEPTELLAKLSRSLAV